MPFFLIGMIRNISWRCKSSACRRYHSRKSI